MILLVVVVIADAGEGDLPTMKTTMMKIVMLSLLYLMAC